MPEKNPIPAGPQGSRPCGFPPVAPALFLLFLPLACVSPPFRGYQIQDPPEGFLYDANSSEAQVIFPHREILNHGAWWRMNVNDQHASIFITRFRGSATVEDVEAARDSYAAMVARSGGGEVTQLQFLRIDGREAWGWEEHRGSRGEPSAVAYRTVVLYDTMAISLEFFSDMPELMDASLQKGALASFGYGKTRILWGWVITLLLLAGVLVVGFFRRVSRSANKPLVTTDYDLPSIPKVQEGKEGPEGSSHQGGEGIG
jgi:hypothetical protein